MAQSGAPSSDVNILSGSAIRACVGKAASAAAQAIITELDSFSEKARAELLREHVRLRALLQRRPPTTCEAKASLADDPESGLTGDSSKRAGQAINTQFDRKADHVRAELLKEHERLRELLQRREPSGSEAAAVHAEPPKIGSLGGSPMRAAPASMPAVVEAPSPLSSMTVCARVRPLSAEERSARAVPPRLLWNEQLHTVEVTGPLGPDDEAQDRASQVFAFDRVFGPHATQDDVWTGSQLNQLVERVCEGFHGTVFAYGQTGSGKTHSMDGFEYVVGATGRHTLREELVAETGAPMAFGGLDEEDAPNSQCGLIPRAILNLFQRIGKLHEETGDRFVVRCSYLQIYNERIYDLLNPVHLAHLRLRERLNVVGLRLRWSADEDFFVENLFTYECATASEVMQHFMYGVRNRRIASHRLNHQSSRSHCVFTLSVERTEASARSGGEVPSVRTSKLSLVDLAGSERLSQTGQDEMGKKEGTFINQSLFVLRRVINALVSEEREVVVPYRESKLTSLLKQSLGGNSYTMILACISACDLSLDDSLSTLQYASHARSIKNEPHMNLDPKSLLIMQLRESVGLASARLAYAQVQFARTSGRALEYPPQLRSHKHDGPGGRCEAHPDGGQSPRPAGTRTGERLCAPSSARATPGSAAAPRGPPGPAPRRLSSSPRPPGDTPRHFIRRLGSLPSLPGSTPRSTDRQLGRKPSSKSLDGGPLPSPPFR